MVLPVEVAGIIETLAYFYIDNETQAGFLIDPGAEPERLLEIIREKNFEIEKILLTHGHFDHIGAVEKIRDEWKIPVAMHENGKKYVSNPDWNLSANFGLDIKISGVDFLPDGSEIALKKNPAFKVKLIAAPGHTEDGAIYFSEKDEVAFVGDTIFCGSVGRTDFPGGDENILRNTIKTRVFTLPDETLLLSGHSNPTTVKNEKLYNPFV